MGSIDNKCHKQKICIGKSNQSLNLNFWWFLLRNPEQKAVTLGIHLKLRQRVVRKTDFILDSFRILISYILQSKDLFIYHPRNNKIVEKSSLLCYVIVHNMMTLV